MELPSPSSWSSKCAGVAVCSRCCGEGVSWLDFLTGLAGTGGGVGSFLFVFNPGELSTSASGGEAMCM